MRKELCRSQWLPTLRWAVCAVPAGQEDTAPSRSTAGSAPAVSPHVPCESPGRGQGCAPVPPCAPARGDALLLGGWSQAGWHRRALLSCQGAGAVQQPGLPHRHQWQLHHQFKDSVWLHSAATQPSGPAIRQDRCHGRINQETASASLRPAFYHVLLHWLPFAQEITVAPSGITAITWLLPSLIALKCSQAPALPEPWAPQASTRCQPEPCWLQPPWGHSHPSSVSPQPGNQHCLHAALVPQPCVKQSCRARQWMCAGRAVVERWGQPGGAAPRGAGAQLRAN